jgi:aryl-alcohol dehydrogenase-like predicted oxidoreductase
MKIKQMGKTGLKVTEICLGTMTFGNQADEAASFAMMDLAAEAGVNFIDTADVYPFPLSFETVGRTEEIVGRWLKGKRDQFVLATKCGNAMSENLNQRGLSRKYILQAIDASLRRLQTDYVDLFYAHQPDPETPIEETMRGLEEVVRSGKARYLACSNFSAWQTAKSLWISDKLNLTSFDAIQPRYNILFREIENEVLPFCREQGLGVIVYNPLAGGFLAGKYQRAQEPAANSRFGLVREPNSLYRERYFKDHHFEAVDALKRFFQERQSDLLHAALAWVLSKPDITSAILGASRPEQLKQTLGGIRLRLDEEEIRFCDDIWFSLPRAKDPRFALR